MRSTRRAVPEIGPVPFFAPCAVMRDFGGRGDEVESETDEVHQVRRTALELLLSDHLGDCVAPCQFGCPAEMDIPRMLRQSWQANSARPSPRSNATSAAGRVGTHLSGPVRKSLPPWRTRFARGNLPVETAGRRCRSRLARAYMPECRPATLGNHVAIVGAGTGLSAAYYLRQFGHDCTIFDESSRPVAGCAETTEEALAPRCASSGSGDDPCDWNQDGMRNRHRPELGRFADQVRRGAYGVRSNGEQQAAGWGLPVIQRGIRVEMKTSSNGIARGVCRRQRHPHKRDGGSKRRRREGSGRCDRLVSAEYRWSGSVEPLSTKIGRMDHQELFSSRNKEVVSSQLSVVRNGERREGREERKRQISDSPTLQISEF